MYNVKNIFVLERKKLSTNVIFCNYLNDFKDIVQHNGLVQIEMNIVCQLLCTVNLSKYTYIIVEYILINLSLCKYKFVQ